MIERYTREQNDKKIQGGYLDRIVSYHFPVPETFKAFTSKLTLEIGIKFGLNAILGMICSLT